MNLFVFERQLKRFLPFADRGLDLDAWTAKYVSDEAARPA
jgi:hypothetical protein